MAKIKNVSGEPRHLPWLGGRLVQKGQEVDVPDEDVTAYTQQEQTWAPADAVAKQLHDEMLAGIAELLADEDQGELTYERFTAETVANAGAAELIAKVKDATAEQAEVLLELEQEAAKPRSTVIAAAEKRLAELAPQDDNDDDPDGDPAPGTDNTPED